MGLTLTSDDKGVKVYVKEREWSGGTFKVYSMGVSSKDKSDNWVNGFVDVQFKKADADRITNKCKIKIKNAFPIVNESGDRKYVKWFINDFDVLEAGEGSVSGNIDDFMKISDEMINEMPFV